MHDCCPYKFNVKTLLPPVYSSSTKQAVILTKKTERNILANIYPPIPSYNCGYFKIDESEGRCCVPTILMFTSCKSFSFLEKSIFVSYNCTLLYHNILRYITSEKERGVCDAGEMD